jgi:hypothetical protein
MRQLVFGFALSAIVACAAAEAETCEELRSSIAYDDPGPWQATPQQLTMHVPGTRSGALLWVIGGETTVVVNTTLDTDSAQAVDRIHHEGSGDSDADRLSCTDSVVMTATVELVTADGGLQETLTVELEAIQGAGAGVVEGFVDLSDHQFAGPISWRPGDDTSEIFLRLRWVGDPSGTVLGWLVWGNSDAVEIRGDELVGEGVNQVIAQFETSFQPA